MIDANEGWHTERLALEPVLPAHAAELAPLLDDPGLHEFIGGEPLTEAELEARYQRLATRRSADGEHIYGHWVLRIRDTKAAIGWVEATLPAAGPVAGAAEVAWVLSKPGQGKGYAAEAALSLVERLRAGGWAVVAYVHPEHRASQRVARETGLRPTDAVVDGEVRWVSPPR
jgi:RimJ/RimL family protein N-acetyltransferase